MARTVLAQFAVNNFSGVRNIPSTAIDDAAATDAGLELDGSTMLDKSVVVTLATEVSTDGGATWPYKDSAQVNGGESTRQGTPVPLYNLDAGLPPAVDGVTRLLRGTVTVTGRLTTTVTAYTA